MYLTEDANLRDSGFSSATQSLTVPRHRWYAVKEAFSPELVKHACNESNIEKGSTLFDPFSGSGTVCLSAAQNGFKAKATEVNPFLAFLGKTKLTTCTPDMFLKAYESVRLASDSDQVCELEKFSTFSSKSGRDKWLFPLKPLRAVMSGLASLEGNSSAESDLMKVALLGAVMDCCNAFKDGKCLRYKRNWAENESTRADFFDFLDHRVQMIKHDLSTDTLDASDCSIVEGDVRAQIKGLESQPFDLVLTSPPYLNSFDYSDVYRPELFLGGFVKNNDELMKLRLKTLRSHVQAKWEDPQESMFGHLYSDAFSAVTSRESSLWDRRLPLMIRAYFEDMSNLLTAVRAKSSSKCQFWIVVSTSAYAGVEIPVDLILAEMASSRGWLLKQVSVVRRLRSSSQHTLRGVSGCYDPVQLRESVVIVEADPKWNPEKGKSTLRKKGE
ncbi:MAG: hypothetical protein KF824_05405 [Fimbriimonadaceae bacterium]|nr:MAG: hypothetical protein KF824_05405 [Fimbriimonadaceae bacterium]